VCSNRPVQCKDCYIIIPDSKLSSHIFEECPNVVIRCKFGCSVSLPRYKIEEHEAENTCPMEPILCGMCDLLWKRCEMEEHEKDIKSHIMLMKEKHISTRNQLKEISQENKMLWTMFPMCLPPIIKIGPNLLKLVSYKCDGSRVIICDTCPQMPRPTIKPLHNGTDIAWGYHCTMRPDFDMCLNCCSESIRSVCLQSLR